MMARKHGPGPEILRCLLVRLVLLCAAPALLGGAPLIGQQEELSPKQIKRLLGSPDSHRRHKGWKRLNPEEKSHYDIILKIFRALSWHDRDGASLALSKAATDETLERIVKDLKKHKNPFVRQGIARALALMNDESVYPHLYEAVGDKNRFVRRVVVDALKEHKKPDAVEALVNRFLVERDPVVNTFIERSLNRLTQAFLGPNPQAWAAWWNEAKHDPDYTLGKTDKEAKRQAEKLGRRLRTKRRTLAGVLLETSERGSGDGVPILVIPDYGRSKKIMLPFFSELEKNHKMYYIDLPPIKSFKGLVASGAAGVPFYPIDKLVEAFEELRAKTGHKRFALMASRLNSWIAMRYAKLHPKSLAAMILVAPLSGNKKFGDAAARLIKTGEETDDREMAHLGMTFTFNGETGETNHDRYHRQNEIKKPAGEDEALNRRSFSLLFKDERDSTISILYPERGHPMGRVAIARFNLFAEEPPSRTVPTLVVSGKASRLTTLKDGKKIAEFYDGLFLPYQNSSCMPFAEESVRFNKDVAAFLGKYAGKKERLKKKKKKKKKKRKREAPAS